MEYKIKRNYPKFGAYLAAARRKRGLTQKELSDHLGYSSAQFISNFERGIATPPLKKLPKIIKKLNLDTKEVVNFMMQERRKELRGELLC